jgi:glucuronoarabinoxylan endo-1,4-beta-xylanase
MPVCFAYCASRERRAAVGSRPVFSAFRGASCAAIAGAVALASMPARAQGTPPVTVTPSQRAQAIDGFGASSAWNDQDMDDASADLAFTVDAGVGLSLLRVRIAPDGGCLEVGTAQKAQERGVKVWATPWSPPAEWKNNDNINDGGILLPEHYDDWSQTLVNFARMMGDAGVPLAFLSAQNEPDFVAATYDSCTYTPDALADFIGNHLGPALADAGLIDAYGRPLRVMGPETDGWGTPNGNANFPPFKAAIKASPAAMQAVGVIASHSYNGTPQADPSINASNQGFWETEVADTKDPQDPGIASGLWVAQQIHQALVGAGMNAWHYWWIYPSGPDNQGLWNIPTDAGKFGPAKRLYTMGNFSRFIRPGFYRINATAQPIANVLVSAYYDAPSSTAVIVAINGTSSPVSQTFQLNAATSDSWASWVTSATQNLAPGDAIVGGDPFTYTLQAQSVTTMVGHITSVSDAGAPEGGLDNGTTGGGTYVSIPATNSGATSSGCALACSATSGLAGGAAGLGGAGVMVLLGVARRRSRRRGDRAS